MINFILNNMLHVGKGQLAILNVIFDLPKSSHKNINAIFKEIKLCFIQNSSIKTCLWEFHHTPHGTNLLPTIHLSIKVSKADVPLLPTVVPLISLCCLDTTPKGSRVTHNYRTLHVKSQYLYSKVSQAYHSQHFCLLACVPHSLFSVITHFILLYGNFFPHLSLLHNSLTLLVLHCFCVIPSQMSYTIPGHHSKSTAM